MSPSRKKVNEGKRFESNSTRDCFHSVYSQALSRALGTKEMTAHNQYIYQTVQLTKRELLLIDGDHCVGSIGEMLYIQLSTR